MKIYVDADACPKVIKEILFRVAGRTGVSIIFVANKYMMLPAVANLSFVLVEAGSDVADGRIVELCVAGDMVVTADIPLAAAVVKKGAFALNPRGEIYDESNIGQILAMRDLMDSLRGGLMEDGRGGPAPFSAKDRENFANKLDKFMAGKF
ncbi:MAG: YaiI/YqxD family protein [Alphaproteobacteria bacterium]|nr:YaiI/YqxD family protein [Alphaproteobacteria bacterium]